MKSNVADVEILLPEAMIVVTEVTVIAPPVTRIGEMSDDSEATVQIRKVLGRWKAVETTNLRMAPLAPVEVVTAVTAPLPKGPKRARVKAAKNAKDAVDRGAAVVAKDRNNRRNFLPAA